MKFSAILFILFLVVLLLVREYISTKRIKASKIKAIRMIEIAKKRSETLLKEASLEAKDHLFRMKSEFDLESRETKIELKKLENRLVRKEENIDRKSLQMEKRETSITNNEKKINKRLDEIVRSERKYATLILEQQIQLEHISKITASQAKSILLKSMEKDARREGAKIAREIENEAIEEADKRAKKIIATAIQRYASDFVTERSTSIIQLPDDEMKGRIIGREGRNIRTIEALTGVDLIIDDTPEAVIISAFNPVRREIARLAIKKLVSDGRIHPARIEEVVKKARGEIDIIIKEAGEQAAFDLGVHGISSTLIKTLGSLKYRTSYSQNVLQHSIEVGLLCGIMASELGLKSKIARRIGLLHDIGKAVDCEIDGPHAVIGANHAKKMGESKIITHAIESHHEDIPVTSVYALLLQAADSLSGARPGARKELLENYVKRLEDLEGIANSFKGVSNSYVVQAGREVRVVVEGEKISDDESLLLSRDIARKIEKLLIFPGQIKVTVIREIRSVDYANK